MKESNMDQDANETELADGTDAQQAEQDRGDGAADPDQDAAGGPNREAAKYRTQLRQAEAETNRLAAALAAMQRAEVIRLAGERLKKGDDLLQFRGDDIAGYLAEDGTVDPGKVGSAVADLLSERSYLSGRMFQGTADQGSRKSVRPPERIGGIFQAKD